MENLKINTKYEILTPDGWKDFYGIRKINKSSYVKLKNYNLICSDNHKLLINDEWKLSVDLDHDSYKEDIELYDPVGIDNSIYYSNDLVSHNCDFIGSSDTLVASHKLHTLTYSPPLIRNKDGFWIYDEPVKDQNDSNNDHVYFMTVDTARGQGKDYSAFVVIDVTKPPYKVVAKFRNNIISPLVFPSIIRSVGKKYNDAWILVEVNDIGSQVADVLHTDLQYENLVKVNMLGRKGQIISEFGGSKNLQFGVKTSSLVKKLGCSVLKNLIEQDKLQFSDIDIINELTTFIAKRTSFEADEGHNDDLVMCLVLFAWATRQDFFENLTNLDVRLEMYQSQIEQIESELLPLLYNDGTDVGDKENNLDEDAWILVDKDKIPKKVIFDKRDTIDGWFV